MQREWYAANTVYTMMIANIGSQILDNPGWNSDKTYFYIFPPGLNFLFHQNSLFITTNDNIWRMHLIWGEERGGGQNEF